MDEEGGCKNGKKRLEALDKDKKEAVEKHKGESLQKEASMEEEIGEDVPQHVGDIEK